MNKTEVRHQVLMVDDDRLFCTAVSLYFQSDPFDITRVHTFVEAQALCRQNEYDVVLVDYNLPGGKGLDLIPDIFQLSSRTKIILITAYPSIDNAVGALKTGAYDFLTKPIELEELRVALERAIRAGQLEHLEQVQQYKDGRESAETLLLGESPAFAEIKDLMAKATQTTAPVLITGETGTGKTAVAKAIHYGTRQARGTFLSVNCAAIPENLIEAELFGFEKGSFTGAVAMHQGVFEIASGGTLFLDEIGEMPFQLQSKLLHVVEDHVVKRIGSNLFRPVSVRLIAATNLDLEKAIAEKRFRKDLYYRLCVIHLHLPPLRQRPQDIPELCRFFMRKLAPGRQVQVLPAELEILRRYTWPGNIRELKNVIERALILQEGPWLRPAGLLGTGSQSQMTGDPAPPVEPNLPSLAEVERLHILKALKLCSGNYSRTAVALGISFSTLKRKLAEYGFRPLVQNE